MNHTTENIALLDYLLSKVGDFVLLSDYFFQRFDEEKLESMDDKEVIGLFKLLTEKLLKAEEMKSKINQSDNVAYAFDLFEEN